MRVIHIITTLDNGGAEKQLVLFIRHQINTSIKCEVLFLKGTAPLKSELEYLGIKVKKLSPLVFLNLVAGIRFKKLTKQKNSKVIIHTHLPRSEIVGLLACLLSCIPLVVSKHNVEKMWPNGPSWASKFIATIVYRKSSAIVCISRAVKTSLQQIRELPMESNKVKVIHYGFGKTVKRTPKKINSHLNILTLARLEPQKDLPTLIGACEKLQSKGIRVNVRIRGNGRLKSYLEKQIRDKNLTNIEILPNIVNIEPELLWADLLVLPSKYEGFGLVLLEAMQYKIMILAANSSAVEEVLGSESTLLFQVGEVDELADRIQILSNSSRHRTENLKRVEERGKLFDISTQVSLTNTLYESILL